MKTLHYSIIVISIAVLFIGTSNSVYAPCLVGVTSCGPPPEVTVVIDTDSSFYEKNDTINVQGRVYVQNYSKPITIDVINPNGTVIQSSMPSINNGTFGTKIVADFNTTGLYQIATCVQSWCDRQYFKFIAEPYNIVVSGHDYIIKYKSSADLVGIDADITNNALRVHVANGSGKFVIELPRALIDSQEYGRDASFKVLIGMHQPDKYMQPANFTEISENNLSRTLAINIPYEPISNTAGIWDFKIMPVIAVSGPAVSTEPPLKQFRHGTLAKDVTCWQGLQLILKSSDGSPACVKPEHVSRLVHNGWSEYPETSIRDTGIIHDVIKPNYFPNILERHIVMNVERGSDLPYLSVNVSDKVTLKNSSNQVIFQQLVAQWENNKPLDRELKVEDDNGNNIGASFFELDSLRSMIFPHSSEEIVFGEPFDMPLRNVSDEIVFTYSMFEIGPVNDTYHLKFASFYPVKINLPSGITITSNDTSIHSQFIDPNSNGFVAPVINSIVISHGNSNIEINSIILYDLTFRTN